MTNEIRPKMRVPCVSVFACSDCHKWLASTLIGETDTARTLRTKHGPFGCRGKFIAAGATNSDCFSKTHAAEATACQRVAAPAAERSELCPECPRSVRFSMRRGQPRADKALESSRS